MGENAADIARDAVRRVAFGSLTTCRNLSVLSLSTTSDDSAAYLTLDEALAQRSVQVREVSDGGHVPELTIVNTGKRPVLLLDGEELLGAKQNRVINLTILAPAQDTRVIPVSCVESGRWRRTSAGFVTASRAQFAEGRAAKMQHVTSSLRESGSHASDQREVWDLIAEKSARLGARSETSAMSAMFDSHEGSLDEFVAAFTPVAGQAGAVFFVNGRPAGLELFDAARTWRTLAPKLIRSYALDALDVSDEVVESSATAGAKAFIDHLISSHTSVFPAVGAGEDVRFEGADVVGAALVVSGKAIHVSAFPTASTVNKGRRPRARRDRTSEV